MSDSRSVPAQSGCQPTKHILTCMHILTSWTAVPCSERCLAPRSPGAFAYHCAKCRRKADRHILSCFGALGTLLYAHDPRIPTKTPPLEQIVDNITLHDRAVPLRVLEQLDEPLAAHKFWFQYRLNGQVSVAYVLLTQRSVHNRLAPCGGGFAITADDKVEEIVADPEARKLAQSSIRRIVRGIQTSQQACDRWQKQRQAGECIEEQQKLTKQQKERQPPQIGEQLEREWSTNRRERKEIWNDVLRLTGTSPASFWSSETVLDGN